MAKKILKTLLSICAAYLLYAALSMLLPPLIHHDAQAQKPEAINSQGGERVLCIDDNTQALAWRLSLINSAKDEIIISTFSWFMDESGTEIATALYMAALRNVNVKVIVDGMSGFLNLQHSPVFNALISLDNVEVKFYGTINFLTPWKWNYRMHEKYLIADGSLYILGGRNLRNVSIGDYSEKKDLDRDILVYTDGSSLSSAQALRNYFYTVWSSEPCKNAKVRKTKKSEAEKNHFASRYEESKKKFPQAFKTADIKNATHEVELIQILHNPTAAKNKEPVLWKSLIALMQDAQSVTIHTPYVMCNREMIADLTDLCSKNNDVSIIINSPESGANPWGCSDFLNQKKRILKTGINLYTYAGDHSTHTKTILLDDDISIVGSFNFDMRSVYLDTEMMLLIKSPELNAELKAKTEEEKNSSAHIARDGSTEYGKNYPDVKFSTGKKITYALLRIFIRLFRHLL